MKIRLYMDENVMSRSLVNGLRARGVDVLTVSESEREGLDDSEQLEFSTVQKRVLYTSNTRDFYQLHTEWLRGGKSHAGIVFVPRERYSSGEQIRRLPHLIRVKSAESMIDNVEFLSAWQETGL
ncbi:MAG: DUF5615 family PIN-like protein [Desulfococcaceae bacterium]|jgi:hypothetical protein|nr:DUF5615 family PIN-like protein [Desulfococcaceae bacterium]